MARPRVAHAKHQAQPPVALTHRRPATEQRSARPRPPRRPAHFGVHNAHHGALQANANDDLHDHQENRLRTLLVRVLGAEANRHLRLDAEQQEAGKREGALHTGDGVRLQPFAGQRIDGQIAVRMRNQPPEQREQEPAQEEAEREQRDDEAPLGVELCRRVRGTF